MLRTKLFVLLLTGCFSINLLPLQAQVLQNVRTVEITTDATGRGARPEIHFANNRFYIIYHGIGGAAKSASFKVKVYDRNLENVLTEKRIVESDTTYGTTTDIRSVADSEGVYLFFEKANEAKDAAFLFGEKYAFDEGFTKVYAYNGPIVQGAYWHTAKAGDELLDDPASVIVGNQVYVMTKIKGEGGKLFTSVPTYRVRGLDASLSQVDTTFDLTIPEMRGWAFVNSLLHVDNSIYDLQPSLASISPPVNLELRMVRFSEQWQYESNTIISNESWSESMPTGFARDDKNGFYYVTYMQPTGPPNPNQTGPSGGHLWLKVFDSNFRELSSTELTDTEHLGTHATMAIVGDSVYVAYGQSVPEPYKENVVVKVYRKDISVGVETPGDAVPEHFKLLQNYPNPFNPTTTIRYDIPKESLVTLDVYNILGQRIAVLVKGLKPAGDYKTVFNASNLPSGVYIYMLRAENFLRVKKMILLK